MRMGVDQHHNEFLIQKNGANGRRWISSCSFPYVKPPSLMNVRRYSRLDIRATNSEGLLRQGIMPMTETSFRDFFRLRHGVRGPSTRQRPEQARLQLHLNRRLGPITSSKSWTRLSS